MEQLELVAINWFELWKQMGGEGHTTYMNNYIIVPIFANYGVRIKKNENLILLFFSKYIAKFFMNLLILMLLYQCLKMKNIITMYTNIIAMYGDL